MKKSKLISSILMFAISLMVLASCTSSEQIAKYSVTFDYDYNLKIENVLVESGKKVSKPSEVEREGYRFLYWALGEEEYNFNTPITKDITLKAVWLKLRPVNVVIDGKNEIVFVEEKNSYSLQDFNIAKNDATLVGFYKQKDNVIEPVNLAEGIKNEDVLYADFMSNGLDITQIIGTDKMQIIDYTGSSNNIILPSFYNGMPVVNIARRALNQNVIDSIDFGKNITEIGIGAFSECTIDNIVIPSSVREIGDNAFAKSSINSFTFEQNSKLRSLGKEAFFEVSNLKNIVLPDRLTAIKYQTFAKCDSLQWVYVPNSVILLENYIFSASFNVQTVYRQYKIKELVEQGIYEDGLDWDRTNPYDNHRVPVQYVRNAQDI